MTPQAGTVLPMLCVRDRLADPSVLWAPLHEHGVEPTGPRAVQADG